MGEVKEYGTSRRKLLRAAETLGGLRRASGSIRERGSWAGGARGGSELGGDRVWLSWGNETTGSVDTSRFSKGDLKW